MSEQEQFLLLKEGSKDAYAHFFVRHNGGYFISNGLDINIISYRFRLSPQTVRNHKAQAMAFLRSKLYDRDLVMPLILSIILQYLEGQ